MTYRNDITAEELRKIIHYEPETGIFTWLAREGDDPLTRMRNTKYAGKAAGCIHNTLGYRLIGIDGQRYKAHRLVFLYMTGQWPNADIDHIDLDPSNNRWRNLRGATQAQNMANTRTRRDNTSGWKGASRHGCGWRAKIQVRGKQICLGTFPTPEEAHAAYCEAAVKYYGDFART